MAGRAGLGFMSGFTTRALTNPTCLARGDAQFCGRTARGLFERDLEVVAQIRATMRRIGAMGTPSCTKNIAEDIAESLGEAAARKAACPGGLGIDASMTKLVISRALLRIRQDFVGRVHLFEAFFSRLIARIAVRVIFHG
jgi:hypothetical protein